MARLLIKAVDATHPSPAEDKRDCYKRNDTVVIREDTHVWGGMEGLPDFYQVDVPGVGADSLYFLLDADSELPSEYIPLSLLPLVAETQAMLDRPPISYIRRRRYRVDTDALTFVDGLATTSSLPYINKREEDRNAP